MLPMLFVLASTMTAGYKMIFGASPTSFSRMLEDGRELGNTRLLVQGGLNIFFTLFMIGSVLLILFEAVSRWQTGSRADRSAQKQ